MSLLGHMAIWVWVNTAKQIKYLKYQTFLSKNYLEELEWRVLSLFSLRYTKIRSNNTMSICCPSWKKIFAPYQRMGLLDTNLQAYKIRWYSPLAKEIWNRQSYGREKRFMLNVPSYILLKCNKILGSVQNTFLSEYLSSVRIVRALWVRWTKFCSPNIYWNISFDHSSLNAEACQLWSRQKSRWKKI